MQVASKNPVNEWQYVSSLELERFHCKITCHVLMARSMSFFFFGGGGGGGRVVSTVCQRASQVSCFIVMTMRETDGENKKKAEIPMERIISVLLFFNILIL